MDTLGPARTETYEHTITGLLTKRAELFNEAERIGIEENEVNIRNKLSRGKFTAAFLLPVPGGYRLWELKIR